MLYLHVVTSLLRLGLITAVTGQPFESAPAVSPRRQPRASSCRHRVDTDHMIIAPKAAVLARKEEKCVDKLPGVCERKPGVKLVCLTGKWWCEWPEKVYQTPVWWPVPNSCDCKEGDLDSDEENK